MLRNYLKVAIRNIFKHKGFSFINISGLALGMACAVFLFLWVKDELSFNRFHQKRDILYRLEQDQKSPEGNYHVTVTPYPVGPALKEQIPEISNSTRMTRIGTVLVRSGENSFFENSISAVDPSFFEMFTFPLINGDEKTILKGQYSIVLNESMAKKYFGNDNAIGKTLTINNKYIFTITGVLNDAPKNSSMSPEMLVPFDFCRELGQYRDSWASNSISTFIEMPDKSKIKSVNEKITNLIFEHSKKDSKDYKPDFMLMPILDIRLFGYFGFGQVYGTIQSVYMFSALGILILIIACINFMNLSTARAAIRAKEVGLRKVVGAQKRNIIGQFYGESILITFISLIFSFILVLLLIPIFNKLSAKNFTNNSLLSWEFLIGLLCITLFAGILSGSYPALFVSSFQPITVLKGKLKNSTKSGFFRKFLVVTQFALSVILVIGTIVIYQQVNYMRNKNVGYDKEQLIYLPLRGETRTMYEVLKDQLLKDSRVAGVSGANQPPTNFGSNSWGAEWDGKDPNRNVLIGTAVVDFDFVETMKIGMAEGRTFSKNYSTDTANAFMVNEEVLKLMGTNSAAGKRFKFNGRDGTIIGVMKNFHFRSVQNNIEPIAFRVYPPRISVAIVRLSRDNITASIDYVKSTWTKVFPNYPFDYRFFDEDFAQMYEQDERTGSILKYATFLAIFIACLGLFGMASFMAEQRTKEIGIRKVLGSSISGITFMLSREFVKWVAAANIIAWPIAYLLINKWLESYAYKVEISWWIFALTGGLTLAIALLTVSYQSIKAARSNPIESLRYE